MSVVWLASSFGYYLVLALVNTFTKIYFLGLTNAGSELLAYAVSSYCYYKLGVKLSLILGFTVSTLGGVLILSWGLENQDSSLFFVFFLLAKFGVSSCFNIQMIANSFFFPTLFAATAFGITNFTARVFSAFSYPISSLNEPWPMIIFTGMCGFTAVLSFFLRTEKEKDKDETKE